MAERMTGRPRTARMATLVPPGAGDPGFALTPRLASRSGADGDPFFLRILKESPMIMPKTDTTDAVPLAYVGEMEVRAQLAIIAERRRDKTIGFDKDMAMATAALARALVGFENERRQQAKAKARELGSFQLDELIEHIKGMTDDQRSQVVEELTGTAGDRGLL